MRSDHIFLPFCDSVPLENLQIVQILESLPFIVTIPETYFAEMVNFLHDIHKTKNNKQNIIKCTVERSSVCPAKE